MFNPYAQFMANFRDHALLVYAKRGASLDFSSRKFPGISYTSDTLARHALPASASGSAVEEMA
jgi:hypothetical protein